MADAGRVNASTQTFYAAKRPPRRARRWSSVCTRVLPATLLARQKKYAEAETPARAALQANPAHDVAVAALGEALVGQKKHDEAIERLSAALARPCCPRCAERRAP